MSRLNRKIILSKIIFLLLTIITIILITSPVIGGVGNTTRFNVVVIVSNEPLENRTFGIQNKSSTTINYNNTYFLNKTNNTTNRILLTTKTIFSIEDISFGKKFVEFLPILKKQYEND